MHVHGVSVCACVPESVLIRTSVSWRWALGGTSSTPSLLPQYQPLETEPGLCGEPADSGAGHAETTTPHCVAESKGLTGVGSARGAPTSQTYTVWAPNDTMVTTGLRAGQ